MRAFQRLIGLVCTAGLLLAGCGQAEPSGTELHDRRPMVMVNGQLYLDTGKEILEEIAEEEILGEIVSSVPQTEIPSQEGQSNFGCEGSPYASYEEDIALCIDGTWYWFEALPQGEG